MKTFLCKVFGILRSFGILILFSAFIQSCNHSLDECCSVSELELTIMADRIGSRTTLNGLSLSWETNDVIGVFASDIQSNKCFSYVTDDYFKGYFDPKEINEDKIPYYAYYPYSDSFEGYRVNSTLSNYQRGYFDSKYDCIVADSVYDRYDEKYPPSLSFTFSNHLFAILKFEIKNTAPELENEILYRISVGASGKILAGDYSFDVSDGAEALVVFGSQTFDVINVTIPHSMQKPFGILPTSLYAVVNPGEYDNLHIIVTTNNHQFEKIIEGPVNVKSGVITNFNPIDVAALTKIERKYSYDCAFIGDSVTYFWGDFDPYFFEDNLYLNGGRSAEKTSSMVSRFKTSIIDNKPRAVAILGGTNNIGANPCDSELLAIRDDYATMADMAEASGIVPIICSILPRKNLNEYVIKANALLKEYAEQHGYEYVDYYEKMSEDDKIIGSLFNDGVHPNESGYQLMESVIQPVINRLNQ